MLWELSYKSEFYCNIVIIRNDTVARIEKVEVLLYEYLSAILRMSRQGQRHASASVYVPSVASG